MDDFNFPTIHNNTPNQQLPFPNSLWFLSSSGPTEPDRQLRRSVSAAEDFNDVDDDEDDKMDMLWEDFNDMSCEMKKNAMSKSVRDRPIITDGRGSLFRRMRRPSLVTLIKVLKKMVLLQKTTTSIMKRSSSLFHKV